ncbi:membrane protein insertase YidC [Heyndrickxia acidicola]|uniref:Membrane protein insertase YidC n=2 Tax=Heyndrickxia acidicola TaxID=209389 RepID=A0ABU6MDG1_9BACI|nr:membrane protein insertase YidC [Heyndrickxia acidicola]MED1202707.1 membrane protein insertase YidC [Heyndrickxia acidicola]
MLLMLSGCAQINHSSIVDGSGVWYQFVVYPLACIIICTAKLFGNSYGLSIIMITIFVRLLILPLMLKQITTSKKMKSIESQLKIIQQKYTAKDAQSQQKMQQETMQLFRSHHINPLAGCFPLIIQIPILLGFYQAMNDIPVLQEAQFLWFRLGSPDFILAIASGVTTFFQQKTMMSDTYSQNPQMAMMLWVMPLMVGFISIGVPAALPLYWIIGNIFVLLQTYFIKFPYMQKEMINRGNLEGAEK